MFFFPIVQGYFEPLWLLVLFSHSGPSYIFMLNSIERCDEEEPLLNLFSAL